VGNRLSEARTGSVVKTTTYTYDANDRLTTEVVTGTGAGTTTYTYDTAGNLTQKDAPGGIEQYAYDDANRLREYTDTASQVTRYAYNHAGIRLSQTQNATGSTPSTTHYLIDPNTAYAQVLEEHSQVGSGTKTLSALYVLGDDRISQYRPAAGSTAASTRHYHADGLGSTRLLTNTSATVTDRYTYHAFGELDLPGSTVTSPNDFLYTGEQHDPNSGFYYLRARYMNPSNGRFTQQDTYIGFEADPPGLHKYVYANNDAVNRVDRSGLFSLIELTTGQNLQNILKAYNVASFAVDLYTGGMAGGAKAIAQEIVFGKLSKFRPITKMSDQVIGLFAKIWSRGVKLKLGLPYKSSTLRHNMEQVLGPLPSGHIPHHIVPSTSPAMKKLKDFGIDPNSPSNGVALPGRAGSGSISAPHTGRHCTAYYRFVERLVMGANDKEEVINALSLIRQELLTGAAQVQGCT